jgi:hypothetical protein
MSTGPAFSAANQHLPLKRRASPSAKRSLWREHRAQQEGSRRGLAEAALELCSLAGVRGNSARTRRGRRDNVLSIGGTSGNDQPVVQGKMVLVWKCQSGRRIDHSGQACERTTEAACVIATNTAPSKAAEAALDGVSSLARLVLNG